MSAENEVLIVPPATPHFLTPPPTMPSTRHPSVNRKTPGYLDNNDNTTIDPVLLRPPPSTLSVSPGGSKHPPLSADPSFKHPAPASTSRVDRTSRPAQDDEEDELEEDDDGPASPRPEKRRKVNAAGHRRKQGSISHPPASPAASRRTAPGHRGSSPGSPPSSSLPGGGGGHARDLSIQPVGFAASRGLAGNQPLLSPVVMGFDFKMVNETDLKTVRETISIMEQQQALIAKRRRENESSTPNTPKELTFKGWQPKEDRSGSGPGSGSGVGRRREKTRDKVERMSINTSARDQDIVPSSKSAPLNHALLAQQQAAGGRAGGPQTSLPPDHGEQGHYAMDPRTADPRMRGGNHEFARQQQGGPFFRRFEPGHAGHPRSAGMALDRRVMTMPGGGGHHTHARRTSAYSHARKSSAQHDSHRSSGSPAQQHAGAGGNGGGSSSASSGVASSPAITTGTTALTSASHVHSGFPDAAANLGLNGSSSTAMHRPEDHLFDLIQQTEALKYSLQELHRRFEQTQQTQATAFHEFKGTAAQASTLLGTLQQSADSLKEMVRYEVQRAEWNEVEGLKARVKVLEALVGDKASNGAANGSTVGTAESVPADG